MDQKTKQQEQAPSSMESGISDSTKYEYWEEKSSGKIYACKIDENSTAFHGPLSHAQISTSPEGFTYTTNQEILSRPQDFNKLTYSEALEKLNQKSPKQEEIPTSS